MNKRILYLLTFLAGSFVMTIEVTASRLLAPYFGSTLFIWTSSIAVILAALSVGYFIASRLAQKPHIEVLLQRALVGASLATFFAPYAVYFIGSFLPSNASSGLPSPLLFATTFIVSLLALMPAGVFYGCISPLVIELLGRDGHHPGTVAGTVFAISTLGSITGTILGAMLFIPFIGTHITFLLSASVMAFLGVLINKKNTLKIALLILFIIFVGALTKPNPLKKSEVIAFAASPYQDIYLIDKGDRYDFIFNEGFGVQSVYYKDTPYTGAYWDWLTTIPYMREENQQDILFIGFAGGTSSRLFTQTNVQEKVQSIDAVEIDKDVVTLSREYFSENDYGVNVLFNDGRQYLASTDKQYDFILVDAFNGLTMPFQFSTIEFTELVGNHLKEEGIMAINVALGVNDSQLLKGLQDTLATTFPYVYKIASNQSLNKLLLASYAPIETENMSDYEEAAGLLSGILTIEQVNKSKKPLVFTDDHAPIEFLSDMTILDFL